MKPLASAVRACTAASWLGCRPGSPGSPGNSWRARPDPRLFSVALLALESPRWVQVRGSNAAEQQRREANEKSSIFDARSDFFRSSAGVPCLVAPPKARKMQVDCKLTPRGEGWAGCLVLHAVVGPERRDERGRPSLFCVQCEGRLYCPTADMKGGHGQAI
jgi:hypothetical protein